MFAVLRTREADLEKHLTSGQGNEVKDEAREKAREEALKRLAEEAKKPATERRLPEYGSDEDFQLLQALNSLQGTGASKAAFFLCEATNLVAE